jgi:hypothetical protein
MKVLRVIWTTWKRIARFIGDIIARVILSLFYFTLFVPFALGVRLFSDPLGAKAREEINPSWWLERATHDLTVDDARRQF